MKTRSVVLGALLLAALTLTATAQTGKAKGKVYKTPQEVYRAAMVAQLKLDHKTYADCFTKEGLEYEAGISAYAGLDLLDLARKGDEYATRLKKREKAVFDVMARHGLTEKSTKSFKYEREPRQEVMWKTSRALLTLIKNPGAFVIDFRTAQDKTAESRPSENVERDLKERVEHLTDVKVAGDKATGTLNPPPGLKGGMKQPIQFIKIDGGWKIAAPPGWEKVPKGSK
jgi:hypothetical protein